MQNLRVCFLAERKDENCCGCGKCISAALRIKSLGLDLPPSFQAQMFSSPLTQLRGLEGFTDERRRNPVRLAMDAGVPDPWLRDLTRLIEAYGKTECQLR